MAGSPEYQGWSRPSDDARHAERPPRADLIDEALGLILWSANPDGVALLASDGTLLDVNPAGLAMAQCDSAAESAGSEFVALVEEGDRASCRRMLDVAIEGRGASCEFTLTGRKGRSLVLIDNAAPLGGKAERVVGCLLRATSAAAASICCSSSMTCWTSPRSRRAKRSCATRRSMSARS
jgi:PAS domain-containing protein